MSSVEFRDTTYEHYEEGVTKRQRVSVACNKCRERKQRCDGVRPVCRPCRARNLDQVCKYNSLHTPGHGRSGSVNGVEGRSRTESMDGRMDLDRAEDDEPQPWTSSHGDGLATFASNNDDAVYGLSSTVSFFRQVLTDNASDSGAGRGPQDAPSSTSQSQRKRSEAIPDGIRVPFPEQSPRMSSYQTPPPGADDFLECFWNFIHPVFPVLHKTNFMQEYDKLQVPEPGSSNHSGRGKRAHLPPVSTTFLSTVNLVFALGSKRSTYVPDSHKMTVSDTFYQKSREAAYYNILDSASTESVQMLVLTGVYLQSTRHAERCWNAVGLAIRVAQGLGMDTEVERPDQLPQIQREMNRRIWHTCVNLDRLLAMTFGRPTMIHKANQIPLPAMIDDEYLLEKSEGIQPQEIPCRLGLFISSCTLLELLEEVLELHSMNGPAKMKNQTETSDRNQKLVTRVMDLNRRLDAFLTSVPDYLKESDAGKEHSWYKDLVNLQKHVLTCRFLLIRLLLLRPLLLFTITTEQHKSPSGLLDGTGQSMLDNIITQQSCIQCLNTAYRLIDAVYMNIEKPHSSSGWHCVYFTFSAAIILLASLKCDLLQTETSSGDFESHWKQIMLSLDHYKDRVHSATHAIEALKTAHYRITHNANTQGRPELQSNPSIMDLLTNEPMDPLLRPAIPADEISPDNLGTDTFDPFPLDGFPELYFSTHSTDLEWLQLFQLQPNVS